MLPPPISNHTSVGFSVNKRQVGCTIYLTQTCTATPPPPAPPLSRSPSAVERHRCFSTQECTRAQRPPKPPGKGGRPQPCPPLPQSAGPAPAGSPHGPGRAHRNFPTPRRSRRGVFGSPASGANRAGSPHTHPPSPPPARPAPASPPSAKPPPGPGRLTLPRPRCSRPAAAPRCPAPPHRPARQPLAEAALEAGGAHWLEGAVTLLPPPPPIHPAALGRGLGARLAAGAACGRAGARLCF